MSNLSFDSLTVQNAKSVLAEGIAAIAGGQAEIDLAALQTVDSSAVSVLLAWKRAANESGRPLRYTNIPANLNSLATLYGVESFLAS